MKRRNKSIDDDINQILHYTLNPLYHTEKGNGMNLPEIQGQAYSSGSSSLAGYSDWLNRGSSLALDNAVSDTGTPKKSSSGGFDWVSFGVGSAIDIVRDLLGYAHADKAAQVAYNRQNEFYDEHISMPAKVQEFEDAGLNPMALGAAGPGATSAPAVQQGATPSSAGTDLLGTLLNYKLKSRELDLQEQFLPAKMEQAYANAEYKRELSDWVAPLAETNIAKSQAEIGLALTKIGTEDSQRRLNEAGITETQARSALIIEQAINQEIQNKYADEWQRTEIALRKSQAALNRSDIALNGSKIDEIYSNIETAVQERRLIKQRVIESGAMTGLLNQEARNLNIKEDMLRFDKLNQNARFILEQVEGYTGIAMDVVNTAVNVGSAFTGGGPLIQPVRKPIGFKMK